MILEKSENQPINTYEIKKREWDSDFFGYNVFSIDLTRHKDVDIAQLRKILEKIGSKVCYCYADPNNLHISSRFKESGVEIADRKVTFTKAVIGEGAIDPNIKNVYQTTMSQKILDIALQSGVHSRFNIDKKFDNNEYARLYSEWIRKSISGELASAVFVYFVDGVEAGLITIGSKNGIADIGLLAVDKHYRGLGIGSKLILAAESQARSMNLSSIQVVTQLDNEPACNLYKKNGFNISSTENIYHLWL